jgi:hypothetical protein
VCLLLLLLLLLLSGPTGSTPSTVVVRRLLICPPYGMCCGPTASTTQPWGTARWAGFDLGIGHEPPALSRAKLCGPVPAHARAQTTVLIRRSLSAVAESPFIMWLCCPLLSAAR